jgi:diketogulonate reductase-like aldo/keto reductase
VAFSRRRHSRNEEIKALRLGIDLGINLIDTAEMYADGDAEVLVGDAIAGRRDDVFLVTKVLPEKATRRGTIEACERSLRRLRTNWIDLYLLHWREDIPLQQTVEGFQKLVDEDKISNWGVSNFDVSNIIDLMDVEDGSKVATDQVLYNLTRRDSNSISCPGATIEAFPSWPTHRSSKDGCFRTRSCGILPRSTTRLPPKWRLPGGFGSIL